MDSTNLTLSRLDDRPELTVAIDGREYRFGELPIGRLADLDEYLRRTAIHPVQEIRPHLDGLKAEDRQALLQAARAEGRNWPPRAGTAAGMTALVSTEQGQIELLVAGLSVHHPGLSRDDAIRLYKTLDRQSARDVIAAKRAGREYNVQGLAMRIFLVIMGRGDPDLSDGGDPLPEASGPGATPTRGSTGA